MRHDSITFNATHTFCSPSDADTYWDFRENVCVMSHMIALRNLVHIWCDSFIFYIWHDSFIFWSCVTWIIHMCHGRSFFIGSSVTSFICDTTLIFVTWFIHFPYVTWLLFFFHPWHDSSIHGMTVRFLVMCGMTNSRVTWRIFFWIGTETLGHYGTTIS